MNAMPTMEGGLRLELENPVDWLMMEHIVIDALGDDGGRLAERLGALMDEASDWEEVVMPELRVFFSEQVGVVARAVKAARKDPDAERGEEEAPEGTLHIRREAAEAWYGALNQARLELEARYRFGPSEVMTGRELSGFPEEKLAGFFRMRFYTRLQGLLLDYAMD